MSMAERKNSVVNRLIAWAVNITIWLVLKLAMFNFLKLYVINTTLCLPIFLG